MFKGTRRCSINLSASCVHSGVSFCIRAGKNL